MLRPTYEEYADRVRRQGKRRAAWHFPHEREVIGFLAVNGFCQDEAEAMTFAEREALAAYLRMGTRDV